MNALLRRLLTLCAAFFLLVSCASAPPFKPLEGAGGPAACPALAPETPFTAVHRIALSHAAIGTSVGLGVVKVDGRAGAVHAVLMTLEGLVVCEAAGESGRVHVLRALPPLDTPGFAEGLTADVAFLLLAPGGAPTETGADEEGNPACRWQTAEDTILETLRSPQGSVRKRLYRSDGTVLKEVLALPPFTRGLPAEMRLRVVQPVSYTIELTLIDVEVGD